MPKKPMKKGKSYSRPFSLGQYGPAQRRMRVEKPRREKP